MMSHRIPSAALLLCTLAACGQSPTGSDAHAQPGGPSYDGGFTMGSGNNAAQAGGGFTIGSGNETNESGGYTIGSGNVATADGSESPEPQESSPGTGTAGGGNDAGRGGFTMGSGN